MQIDDFDYVIIGAGITGITLAERFAHSAKSVLLIDKKDHIGGNCYDSVNSDGLLVHNYGPHIFRTRDHDTWHYLNQFTAFNNYRHIVKSFWKDELYDFPVNINTIEKLYGITFKTDEEAAEYVSQLQSSRPVNNAEDYAISIMGERLYEIFVRDYSMKQWGTELKQMKPETLRGRVKIKLSRSPYYFDDQYQGLPSNGYTQMFRNMLDNKNISVTLNTNFKDILPKLSYRLLFVTSPIDEFFDFQFGKLIYRSVQFEHETHQIESYQSAPVINYPAREYKWTRITEFKKLTGQKSTNTTIAKEFSNSAESEKTYPILSYENTRLLEKYLAIVRRQDKIRFIGRLGLFKYLSMDQAVREALDLSNKILT